MNCSQQTNGATNMATLLQKNCIKTLSVNNGVVVVGTAVPSVATSASTANMQPMMSNASHVQPIQAFQYQQLQTVQAQPQYIIYNPSDGTLFRPVTSTTVPNSTIITNNAIYQQHHHPQPIITQSNIQPKIGAVTSNVTAQTHLQQQHLLQPHQKVLNIIAPPKPLIQNAGKLAHVAKMPRLAPMTSTPVRLTPISSPANRAPPLVAVSSAVPALAPTSLPVATTKSKAIAIVNPSNLPNNLGRLQPITTNGTLVRRNDYSIPITSASITNFSDKTLPHTVHTVHRGIVQNNRGPYTITNPVVTNHQRVTPVQNVNVGMKFNNVAVAGANTTAAVINSVATATTTPTTLAHPVDTQPIGKTLTNNNINAPSIVPIHQTPAVIEKPAQKVEPTAAPIIMEVDEVKTEEDTEAEPEIDIVINNVVCSFSVRCHLNLREIALNGRNVEFRRENGMVTMKLRKPYTTASIWSSGRITCTGATSEDQAKVGARRYARVLQSLGFPVRFNHFRVVNVLGTCSMPWAIKIVNFSEKYKKEASYEPELHPGVTYKLRTPKATLKIFSTGSITVTAGSVNDVQTAIEHIYPLVHEFRKNRPKTEPVAPPVEAFDPDDEEALNGIAGKGGKRDASKAPAKTAQKTVKRKYPFGMAENDPDEDLMGISDVESDADDVIDEY